jgi:MYXO-CTERM domain-containing protein
MSAKLQAAATRIAEAVGESMDADYGSSPRLGQDNPSATPVDLSVPPALSAWLEKLSAQITQLNSQASKMVQEKPGTSIGLAALAGFAAAALLLRRR